MSLSDTDVALYVLCVYARALASVRVCVCVVCVVCLYTCVHVCVRECECVCVLVGLQLGEEVMAFGMGQLMVISVVKG